MTLWNKFQEYDAVHRHVPSRCCPNQCPDDAKADKAGGAGSYAAKNAAEEDCRVERGFPSYQVSGRSPTKGADYHADIVGYRAEAQARYVLKLVGDGRADGRNALTPEIIAHPTQAVDSE